MNKDSFDLPVSSKKREIINITPSEKFTASHKMEMINHGVNFAFQGADIAKSFVEIYRIREQSEADVKIIRARIDGIKEIYSKEIELHKSNNDKIKITGSEIRGIIREVGDILKSTNMSDDVKSKLIEQIPICVQMVVSNKNTDDILKYVMSK